MARFCRGTLAIACAFAFQSALANTIFDGSEIPIPGNPEAVASDGAGFLAVWPCGTAICGARISATGGAVQAHELVTTTSDPWHVRIAFDGMNFLVVWTEYPSFFESVLYAARITPAGVNLDPGGILVSSPETATYVDPDNWFASVGFDGTNFVVYWTSYYYGAIYRARVSSDGELLDPLGEPLPGIYYYEGWNRDIIVERDVAIAWRCPSQNGGHCLQYGVALLPDRWLGGIIFQALRYPDISVGDSSVLLAFTASEDAYSTSYGNDWAWGAGVFSYLIGPTGGFNDPTAVGLVQLDSIPSRTLAAYDGLNHFIVWGNYGIRFAQSGELIDAVPHPMPVAGATTLTSNLRGVSLVTSTGSARLLVTRIEVALADAVEVAQSQLVSLNPGVLKNANQLNALTNKLAAIRELIDARMYGDAALTIESMLAKTDGCSAALSPDADDWIRSCNDQRDLFVVLSWMRDIVKSL